MNYQVSYLFHFTGWSASWAAGWRPLPWSYLQCTNNILYSHSRGSSLSLKLLLLLICPLLLAHPFAMWFNWFPSVLAPHTVSSSSGPRRGVAPTTSTTELDPWLKQVSVWSGCKRFSHRELSHGSEKTVCVSSSLICEAQWWLLLEWLGCNMPLLWLWLEE
jgi:hypothetical protein